MNQRFNGKSNTITIYLAMHACIWIHSGCECPLGTVIDESINECVTPSECKAYPRMSGHVGISSNVQAHMENHPYVAFQAISN